MGLAFVDLMGLATSRPSEVDLPRGRSVELPGRGTAFVWEKPGPPGAPTVILIHGLVASGGLNWFPAMGRLAEEYRVVAIDLRGHGRSMRVGTEFRLADCADDVAAVADVLGVARFLVVGYSLGGPVAQLVWHRHRDRVAGLVLCATSRNFGGTAPERLFFTSLLGGVLGVQLFNRLPGPWRTRPVEADHHDRPEEDSDPLISRWAIDELRRTDILAALKAMGSMGRFSSHEWVGSVDVPVAVVITTRDHLVSSSRQIKLAQAIPGATLHPVPAGHAACVIGARRFVPVLAEAVRSVAGRAGLAPVGAE
jgi:3-oxoadipate enol-lactonase